MFFINVNLKVNNKSIISPQWVFFFNLFCFLESAGLKHWPQVNSILCAPPEDFSYSFLPLRWFFNFVFQISKEAQDFIVEQYKHLRERDTTSKPH